MAPYRNIYSKELIQVVYTEKDLTNLKDGKSHTGVNDEKKERHSCMSERVKYIFVIVFRKWSQRAGGETWTPVYKAVS